MVDASPFVEPPDPAAARTLDDLSRQLRLLKVWGGDPSYRTIVSRINARAGGGDHDWLPTSRTTVADCFRTGRSRPNEQLVLAVVHALHPDERYRFRWRDALRAVRGGAAAAGFAIAHDELPADPDGFTGRDRELAAVLAAAEPGATVVIEGMAGVGKTSVAVHAAHLLARSRAFDHVLFADLRGFHPDPSQPPARPAAVLDAFLRLLRVPRGRHRGDGGAELFRSLLRDRAALVVLDDAATAEQVLPLLPLGSAGVALVTSRHGLAGLSFARRLTLDVMDPADAVALLRRTVGGGRTDAEPGVAERIAALSGRLPLALGLVAARIRAGPDWSLADHGDHLAERIGRLQLDDPIAVSIGLSHDAVAEDCRRTLRYAALHPGPRLDEAAVAALPGIDRITARCHLDQLLDQHLLVRHDAGRFALHDLVRAFARARALDTERTADRRDAITRLTEHYLTAATATAAVEFPNEVARWPLPAVTPDVPASDLSVDLPPLEPELPNLLATARESAADRPDLTALLSIALHRFVLRTGRYGDLLTLHELGLDAARRFGDRAVTAWMTLYLGQAHLRTADYERAARLLAEALALFRGLSDRTGEGDALHCLALADRQLGHHRRAGARFRQALAARQAADDRLGMARTLLNLGILDQTAGRHERAIGYHERAGALFAELGENGGVALVQQNLGVVHLLTGRHDTALDLLHLAVLSYRGHRDHGGEAHALADLATGYRLAGDHERAMVHAESALALAADRGDGYVHAYALNAAARIHRELGRPDEAIRLHTAALEFFRDTADPAGQADACDGLAEARERS